MRRVGRSALLCLTVLCAAPGCALAFWDPGAQVVSASDTRHEQADALTRSAAISGDGRYVAFQTTARNLFADIDPDPPGFARQGGIFRKDLGSGALELVASGTLSPVAGGSIIRGALNPSISGGGRYVAFSTAAALVLADTNRRVDVYVRDMALGPGEPGAYVLASAQNDTDVPPTYSSGTTSGSEVSDGGSISADGRRLVFRTAAVSDLAGPATPAGQLFVRDLASKTTELVTRKALDRAPAGGALGATISADGTTVAWTGTNASEQTRFLPGEVEGGVAYYMWRRVADGAAAITRRITGAVDPDDAACPTGELVTQDSTQFGPCYGPLAEREDGAFLGGINSLVPALSIDGRTVAFLSAAGIRPLGGSRMPDLFVTDMTAGVSRKAGTLELTREGPDGAAGGPVLTLAMSGNGRRVAFVTQRTGFILPTPRLVDPPAAQVGGAEVYVLDVPSMRIQRVTRGWDGSQMNGDASNVSITADGRRVAYISAATNLVRGDGNEAADAFVTGEPDQIGAGGTGEPPYDPPQEAGTMPRKIARLGVRAVRAGGALRVTVTAPGAGLVRAAASARGQSRSSRARLRTVARARAPVNSAGRASVTLRPIGRYRARLERRGRLAARLTVRFSPSGGGPLITVIRPVVFRTR